MKRLNYFKTKPKVDSIDINSYLDRLSLDRQTPSLDYLRKLHHAHVHAIPFENLDIHYQKKITLDYRKIFEKIIYQKRGGFCYELNGLFYHLLYHLGFDCYVTSARFLEKSGDYSPEYDHMVIIVRLDEMTYLADVGYGKGYLYPKKMTEHEVQVDDTSYWRFQKDPDENYLLQRSSDMSTYHTLYRFNLQEKQVIQFLEMCEHHQTSSESPFTQKKLITKKTREGRVTLTNFKLKIQELGETREVDILNEDEFLSKLEQYFDITYRQLRNL